MRPENLAFSFDKPCTQSSRIQICCRTFGGDGRSRRHTAHALNRAGSGMNEVDQNGFAQHLRLSEHCVFISFGPENRAGGGIGEVDQNGFAQPPNRWAALAREARGLRDDSVSFSQRLVLSKHSCSSTPVLLLRLGSGWGAGRGGHRSRRS
jgi:hypothetical protein